MATPYGHRALIGLPGTVNALPGSNMLHVTVAKSEDGSIVRLSGDLAGEFVAEADRACAAVDGPLVVDAGQLRGADADGAGPDVGREVQFLRPRRYVPNHRCAGRTSQSIGSPPPTGSSIRR